MDDYISRQEALRAIEEICYALWEIDIPSPTVPEYIEHHEQVQSVMKLAEKWGKELRDLPSAQPARQGHWTLQIDASANAYGWHICSECGVHVGEPTNYCPNCGAKMDGQERITDGL